MSSKKSPTIVKEIFEASFDKERFILFMKTLLKEYDEAGVFARSGDQIPQGYSDFIQSYERIGTYEDGDGKKIDLLIVYLNRDTSSELARPIQRNFLARHLQGCNGSDTYKDTAIVAFVPPTREEWRFSLVKSGLTTACGTDGKTKREMKVDYNPARRWSFLAGCYDKSHTAQKQFAPLLTKGNKKPTLKILEAAFRNVKLTDEFFKEYRRVFAATKSALDEAVRNDPAIKSAKKRKEIDTIDRAQKILGQIHFSYYLGEKKTGAPRDTFYLNSALTTMHLPDALFSHKTQSNPDGDGIFDVFDRYNFTLNEDEPFDKDCAIGPELLGNTYEKLHAIRPDNYIDYLKTTEHGRKGEEGKFNRQHGVYYTPRGIVYYMCRQCLISYIQTELSHIDGADRPTNDEVASLFHYGECWREKEAGCDGMGGGMVSRPDRIPESIRRAAAFIDKLLDTITVCDPAVGSGAFLTVMMSEIVRIREVLQPWSTSTMTSYERKRRCIEHSLYGIDIDAGAVAIARLRLLLSLRKADDEIHNAAPLPNPDYKVDCGNSLLGLPEQWGGAITFDIVIGNPPYHGDLSITERKYFKEQFAIVSSGRQDTCAIFIERAKQISAGRGTLAYLLPYRLFSRRRNHGQLQKWMLSNYALKQIMYLGADVGFPASDEFMIVLATADSPEDNSILVAIKPSTTDLENNTIVFHTIDQSTYIESGEINLNVLHYDKIFLEKISRNTRPLMELCRVRDGIIPYIREQLVKDVKADDRYVKFAGIAGKYTLDRYHFSHDPHWLCYDINEAKKYITDEGKLHKVQLRDKEIFLSRKIVTSQNSATLRGAIDEEQVFVSNSIHSTYLNEENKNHFHLEYILGLMNSKLLNYYHDSLRVKAIDLHPQILLRHLRQLPIKAITKTEQLQIVTLVNRILIAKQKNADTDTAKLESDIDKCVYALYDLTKEEIAIVEGYSGGFVNYQGEIR